MPTNRAKQTIRAPFFVWHFCLSLPRSASPCAPLPSLPLCACALSCLFSPFRVGTEGAPIRLFSPLSLCVCVFALFSFTLYLPQYVTRCCTIDLCSLFPFVPLFSAERFFAPRGIPLLFSAMVNPSYVGKFRLEARSFHRWTFVSSPFSVLDCLLCLFVVSSCHFCGTVHRCFCRSSCSPCSLRRVRESGLTIPSFSPSN